MTAAQEIERGIDFGLHEVGLRPEERNAVLASRRPTEGLLELRAEIVKRRAEAEHRAAHAYWEVLDEKPNSLTAGQALGPPRNPRHLRSRGVRNATSTCRTLGLR